MLDGPRRARLVSTGSLNRTARQASPVNPQPDSTSVSGFRCRNVDGIAKEKRNKKAGFQA